MMIAAATTHVTNIELVMANLPICTNSAGFNDTAGSVSAAIVGLTKATPKSSVKIGNKKQRLRILKCIAVASIGDAGTPRSSAFIPQSRGYGEQADPGYNSNAHTKARFARMTNEIVRGRSLFYRDSFGKRRIEFRGPF